MKSMPQHADMRYKLISFDNTDENWTGNPTVLYDGLSRSEAVTKRNEMTEAYGAMHRYSIYRDKASE